MESSTASWQFENFSTAELSPPISPAPLSPSLYNAGGISPNPATVSGKDGLKYTGTDFLAGSRAQLATNLLRDLEDFESIKYEPQNDLGLNWNEESVNLELFSELSELDYVSPATPASEEFTNQQNLSQFVETITIPTSPIEQPEFSPEVYDKLSAEFQAILESLPPASAGNTSTDEFDDLIAISGIPAHYPETQACVTNNNNNNAFMESHQAVVNDSSMLMELDYAGTGNNYSGLISLDENSNNSNTSAASIYYSGSESDGGECSQMNISEEILEENADAAEKILDALLLGNLVEAQSFLPSMQTLAIDNSITFNAAPIEIIAVPSTSAIVQREQAKPKSETKRPKSSGGRRRNGLNTIVDKSLRKKEQNKTAATRYRLKKKMESVVTSEVENKMQAENDVLQAESNDLARQITIVKQLLRDIMESKKSTKNNTLNRRSF